MTIAKKKVKEEKEMVKYTLFIEKELFDDLNFIADSNDRKLQNQITKILKDYCKEEIITLPKNESMKIISLLDTINKDRKKEKLKPLTVNDILKLYGQGKLVDSE